MLTEHGQGLPDGLRVKVGARAPVGQPDSDHDAWVAVEGDDLRGLCRVEGRMAHLSAFRTGWGMAGSVPVLSVRRRQVA